jgi:hypothetical protein
MNGLGICVLLDVLMYKISKYGILFCCFCLLEVLELGKHTSIWNLYGVWLCGILFCFCLLEVQKLEKTQIFRTRIWMVFGPAFQFQLIRVITYLFYYSRDQMTNLSRTNFIEINVSHHRSPNIS